MVAEVDRICRKNGIEYSLDAGSLLGAIREKGIIPWDDDCDLVFARAEYEKFFEACKKDLDTTRFFLQDYRTDDGYRWRYAKLRRNGTEFIRPNQEHMHYNKGCFIDIFVADNVPDNKIQMYLDHAFWFCTRKILYSEAGKVSAGNAFLRGWYRLLSRIPEKRVFAIQNKVISHNNRKHTKKMIYNGYPMPRDTKYGFPSRFLENYIDVNFEGLKLRAMKDYDEYLQMAYGDYMTPPPIDQRGFATTFSKLTLIPVTHEEILKRYAKAD